MTERQMRYRGKALEWKLDNSLLHTRMMNALARHFWSQLKSDNPEQELLYLADQESKWYLDLMVRGFGADSYRHLQELLADPRRYHPLEANGLVEVQ